MKRPDAVDAVIRSSFYSAERPRTYSPRRSVEAQYGSSSSQVYVHPPVWRRMPPQQHPSVSFHAHMSGASHVAPPSSAGPSSSPFYWEEAQTLQHAPRDTRDRVRELESECLSSLQSSLRVVAGTNEVSQRTAVQLDAQSEQLRGIKETTEEIHENLQTSDYLLKGMKTWWGSFTQLFTSPPAARERSAGAAADRAARSKAPEAEAPEAKPPAFDSRRGWTGADGNEADAHARQQRLAQIQRARTDDFDARMEGGLEKLSVMLEELHGRAVQMNSALQEQNDLLDEINQNVDSNQQALEKQRRTMQKIMKRT
ncbi:hypothetical protein BESB_043960 [Besnoitia besnoiti]|uniref:t-SNARE coiled-coil homology domain-containing protein n=1 Tax=Besnoitia besnoiti TaxID=94643 RepID=A0A2A9MGA7_BESBE|nr:hypothetical protein BESB_043960 [Besnoitia besnoiti]PFH36204.1 hypothetical protein BESB_043960 [Besnoitia besnoiti]